MRWQGRRGSRNIEDRRGRVARGGGSMSLVALLIVLGIGYFFGIDVTPLLQGTGGGAVQTEPAELTEADRRAGEFVSVTLADTEEVWTRVFAEQVGEPYRPPELVLFKGAVQSGCGGASAQTRSPRQRPGNELSR